MGTLSFVVVFIAMIENQGAGRLMADLGFLADPVKCIFGLCSAAMNAETGLVRISGDVPAAVENVR